MYLARAAYTGRMQVPEVPQNYIQEAHIPVFGGIGDSESSVYGRHLLLYFNIELMPILLSTDNI